jgi:T5SS/PEP-CTERM-associated repeat protein
MRNKTSNNHKRLTLESCFLAMVVGLTFCFMPVSRGATQYWDASTNAGYQHGDGYWSTNESDVVWTLTGLSLGAWSNGNNAAFAATNGRSTVRVEGSIVTCAFLYLQGSAYDLVISNGGEVASSSGECLLGYGALDCSGNTVRVIGGAGVTSRLSTVNASLGRPGIGNALIVDGLGVAGSAVFSNRTTFNIGSLNGGKTGGYCRAIVRDGGQLMAGSSTMTLGAGSPFNELVVSGGGVFVVGSMYVGNGAGGLSNTVLITGSNTVVDRTVTLIPDSVGNRVVVANGATLSNVTANLQIRGMGCMLAATNGGRVFSSVTTAYVGYGAESLACSGVVSGAGSVWSLGNKALLIGEGTGSVVLVDDAAVITNVSALRIGGTAAARGNGLVIASGGRVYSGGASAVGYAAGATGNVAVVTGSGSVWSLGGQSLSVGATNTPGNKLTIDNGGSVENVGSLSVGTCNTLEMLNGVLACRQAALQPGAESVVGVAAATEPGAGWGILRVTSGDLVLGGTLRVALRSGFVPSSSDRFTIMTRAGTGSVTGVFSNVGVGGYVKAYDNGGSREKGRFALEIGTGSVTLTGFRPVWPATVMLIR